MIPDRNPGQKYRKEPNMSRIAAMVAEAKAAVATAQNSVRELFFQQYDNGRAVEAQVTDYNGSGSIYVGITVLTGRRRAGGKVPTPRQLSLKAEEFEAIFVEYYNWKQERAETVKAENSQLGGNSF